VTLACRSPILSLPNELLFIIAELWDTKGIFRLILSNRALHERLYDILIQVEVKSHGAKAVL
jgi:hypothetical protein